MYSNKNGFKINFVLSSVKIQVKLIKKHETNLFKVYKDKYDVDIDTLNYDDFSQYICSILLESIGKYAGKELIMIGATALKLFFSSNRMSMDFDFKTIISKDKLSSSGKLTANGIEAEQKKILEKSLKKIIGNILIIKWFQNF